MQASVLGPASVDVVCGGSRARGNCMIAIPTVIITRRFVRHLNIMLQPHMSVVINCIDRYWEQVGHEAAIITISSSVGMFIFQNCQNKGQQKPTLSTQIHKAQDGSTYTV